MRELRVPDLPPEAVHSMTLAVGGWIALANLAMWTVLAHRAYGALRARRFEQRRWS